jgi:hypothetical protein
LLPSNNYSAKETLKIPQNVLTSVVKTYQEEIIQPLNDVSVSKEKKD